MKKKIKETDLYVPIKKYLKKNGYKVKSEVKNCDVVAVNKLDTIIIVELKTSINLKLILQANTRKAITDNVYIGVPEDSPVLKGRRKKAEFLKLLKQLGIGLITVNIKKGSVLPLIDPCIYKPAKNMRKQAALMKEFNELKGDPNKGGSRSGSGNKTAYRQKTVCVAEYLSTYGAQKASDLKETLDEPKAWNILYHNFYGWFDKKERGVYELSKKGHLEFKQWK
jgi:hypothetical protein